MNSSIQPAIYVITGVMAAGKSTVAEALAKRLPRCVHLPGDVFRTMIVNGREDMREAPSASALSQLDLRYRITAKAAQEYYDAGFTVVVEDNYLGEGLTRFVELLGDYLIYPIVLAPTMEIIAERERARANKGYSGYTVESLYRGFMETTPRIGLWLDTSDLIPEETADEILRQVRRARKDLA
jgi:chloramphenicol 3-O-phosphotransferase